MKLTLIVLCHNAPLFVARLLDSIETLQGIDFETVVVDNGSDRQNQITSFITSLNAGHTETYIRSRTNLFFPAGINLGAKLASPDCTHLMYLNSDTEFKDPEALKKMAAMHRPGITGLGVVKSNSVPERPDGFCFLIDRAVHVRFGGLDEQYKWWWSITKLESQVLQAGLSVQAVRHYENLLVHFGGKSGDAWKAVNLPEPPTESALWFNTGARITVIDRIP
jgi:GT2 family glycosyltransferase